MKVFTFENEKFAEFVAFVAQEGGGNVYYRTTSGPTIRVFAVLYAGAALARISSGAHNDSDVMMAFPSAIELDCAIDLRNEDIEPLLG